MEVKKTIEYNWSVGMSSGVSKLLNALTINALANPVEHSGILAESCSGMKKKIRISFR